MAYVKRRQNRRRAPLRSKGSRRPAKRVPRKRTIQRIVKRVMSHQIEKKCQNSSGTISCGTLQSTSPNLVGNYLVISPCQSTSGYTITAGPGENQRIGNSINIKKLTHNFSIYCQQYNATSNTTPRPVYVRLYYFKSKWAPNSDVATGNLCGVNANFFSGQSTDLGFTGALLDLTRKIQSENYTYLTSRTYKLGPALPAIGNTTTTNHIYSNNDFKLSVIGSVNLAQHYKSKYIFNDSNQVMTPWCFCIVQVMDAEGSVLSTSQSLVQMQYNIECEYTDA